MVTYKGCQIVALNNDKKHCAIKSKIYKNAYIGLGSYENCKYMVNVAGSGDRFKINEQNACLLIYFKLNGETIPILELEPITKENK